MKQTIAMFRELDVYKFPHTMHRVFDNSTPLMTNDHFYQHF